MSLEEKRSLLKKLIINEKKKGINFPLSSAQKRIWFLDQFEPESPIYNLHCAIDIKGSLNILVLQKSVNEIIKRHEILRTNFSLIDKTPKQIIHLKATVNIKIIELLNMDSTIRENEINSISKTESLTPFNLAKDQLLRIKLLHLSKNEHTLLITMHHIISDDWSIRIFIKELEALYNASINDLTPPLPAILIQYSDYVMWLHKNLNKENQDKLFLYWGKKLTNIPLLNLPTDFPRPSIKTYSGSSCEVKISKYLTDALKSLSIRQGVTLFMTILTAFKVLIYRYTGQDDISTGSPITNRNIPEVEQLIGFFINTVVLRVDLSGNPSFIDLLKRVKKTTLEAYRYQGYPFEILVEKLKPKRVLSHTPLFQVMFVFNHTFESEFEFSNLKFKWRKLKSYTSKFDLTLNLWETKDTLSGSIEYSTDLFKESTIKRLVHHFHNILMEIVSHPNKKLDDLSFISELEKKKILDIWNNTGQQYLTSKKIQDYFEDQVEKIPYSIALVYKDIHLTYFELNRRADILLSLLNIKNIKPNSLIGICIDRSIEMIIGILAILKKRCAYVPIDPNYPKERITYILKDANLNLVLTQQKYFKKFKDYKIQIINMNKYDRNFLKKNTNYSSNSVIDNDFIYVIYTSGSTGRPKGVLNHQLGVVNRLIWMQKYFNVSTNDVIIQKTPYTFDVSVWEIFLPLISGARLIMTTPDGHKDPNYLIDLIQKENISITHFVPSMLRFFLYYLDVSICNSIRYVICSGETLNEELIKIFKEKSKAKLYNLYGPTEASIDVSYWDCEEINQEHKVLIGSPISNTKLYILDSKLNLVPIGIPGELYIGGIGVAYGYLNQPELTKDNFIYKDFNFHSKTINHIYKSGDLARFHDNGKIEFLGRKDNQIKIRGFRVELDEIENILKQYNNIQDCAIILSKNGILKEILVAYIVLNNESEVNDSKLYHYLNNRLPDYMIPSTIIYLDSLPRNSNGKIDKQSLLSLSSKRPKSYKNYYPAINDTHKKLIKIWSKVLDIKNIGINDNFFQLGGHSLIALQIIIKVKEVFGIDLSLKKFFEFPTISSLTEYLKYSAQLKDEMHSTTYLPEIIAEPFNLYKSFPLSEIQQAYWIGRNKVFEIGNIATHFYFEMECIDLNIHQFNMALNQVINRHNMLKTIVLEDGQQLVLKVVPYYRIDQLDISNYCTNDKKIQLKSIRKKMSHQMIRVDKWPLFRIRSTKIKENVYRLHISFDMLIMDAWSFSIFCKDLLLFYKEPRLTLSPLKLSYRDYIIYQKSFQKLELYKTSREYWYNRLKTLPDHPLLPLDKNPNSIKKPKFKRYISHLEKKQWQQLKASGAKLNLTSTGILLAIYAQVLARWSKNQKFTLTITLFNRPPVHPEIDKIIGDFTSTLLLEIDNSVNESFIHFAKRIQKQLWEDLDHRYFDGISVMRALAANNGNIQKAFIPIVFTSTLGLGGIEEEFQDFSELGEFVYGISQTSQVWLDHQVFEKKGTLIFNWDVVEELFPKGMIDHMFNAYCSYLKQLAMSDKTWHNCNIDFLLKDQLDSQLLINNTKKDVSNDLLHTLFIKQVLKHPNNIALISQDCKLTYLQLYKLACQLSQYIHDYALSNQLVAVYLEKNWQQILAVLAILISGKAYLPIDPHLPEDRVKYLLKNSDISLIITNKLIKQRIYFEHGYEYICIDEENYRNRDSNPPEINQKPGDLAYLIYTSGSTGLPKGVMIDHRGAVNTIIDINRRFKLGPKDKILALSSLSFDLSVYDIFGILTAGGSIVIPDFHRIKDPAHWLELIKKYEISIWNSVPTFMEMFLEYNREKLNSLRLVLLSGDWIPLDLPERIRLQLTGTKIISLGGATEASIWSIYYPINKIKSSWQSIPYGKPLTNQQFYIYNDLMELCPTFVPGNLYIGGIGIARGYWNNEEQSKKCFITHPVNKECLYKTGDLGRYLPDGNIEFLGREDFQVKIAGYRIEIPEIVNTLKKHPNVKDTIIIPEGKDKHYNSLSAYIILNENQNLAHFTHKSNQSTVEDYSTGQKDILILDPIKRLEFKLNQYGLRKFEKHKHRITLSKPDENSKITASYFTRQSFRQFTDEVLTIDKFSKFINCLSQLRVNNLPLPKYRYPSAGNLYPVQTYLYIKNERIENIQSGIYYYNPADHCIINIHANNEIRSEVFGEKDDLNRKIFSQASFAIFLIVKKNAINPLYGNWSRDFCLLEAGYMGQLLMSSCSEYGIGLCPIGHLNFDMIKNLFCLDNDHELLHSFLGGTINPLTIVPCSSNINNKEEDFKIQLSEYLKMKLPSYMIPSSINIVKSFPLNSNGKIDIKTLKKLSSICDKEVVQKHYQESKLEVKIIEIVKNVLQIENIDIKKKLFELGASSIHIIQIFNQLKILSEKEISITDIFKHPSIIDLVKFINEKNSNNIPVKRSLNRAKKRKSSRRKK